MYGVALIALSLVPAALAQSACGLQGFASCTTGTTTKGYGCCPTGYSCLATECAYTGAPTATAKPTTTVCPGVPAHHLCPQSVGGGCCYAAHACDAKNPTQCVLTQTERVFDQVVTVTTVIGGNTQTVTSTSIFYPWPTVEVRKMPISGVQTSSPSASESKTEPAKTTGSASRTTGAANPPATAAAGHIGVQVGGIIGGVVAGLLVQN